MTFGTTIRGYACAFDLRFRPDAPTAMLVKPGAFQIDPVIPVQIDHDDRSVVASTADHVRLWQDGFGLAFEIDVATDALDRLARDVANRKRDAVSVCFSPDRISQMEMIGLQYVEVVASSPLEEISFLEFGACPDARAWLAIAGEDHAPWEYRELEARWRLGKQQQTLSNSRERRKPPSPSGPAGVVHLSARAPSNRRPRPSSGPALSPQLPARKSMPRVPDSVVALIATDVGAVAGGSIIGATVGAVGPVPLYLGAVAKTIATAASCPAPATAIGACLKTQINGDRDDAAKWPGARQASAAVERHGPGGPVHPQGRGKASRRRTSPQR